MSLKKLRAPALPVQRADNEGGFLLNNKLRENEKTVEFSEATENEISILDLIALMIRNWWIIALIGGIFGIASYAYCKTTSVPTYKSTTSLYINTQREQQTDDVNAVALINTINLMPSYIKVLQSRTFFSQVSDAIDNKYSYEEISRMTSLSQDEDTNIVTISVTGVDQQDSYTICSSIADLAANEIFRIFEGGSVKVIDRPKDIPETIVANSFQRGVIGFIVGAALAMFVIFLINMFDTRIESSEELTARYNLPVLGEVPNLSDVS